MAVPPELAEQLEELYRAEQTGFRGAGAAGFPSPDTPVGNQSPARFYERLGASMKTGDAGRLNYWRSIYGAENVAKRGDKILIKTAKGWAPADEPGLSGGDVADLAPELLLTAATGSGGVLPSMARAGAASAGVQAAGAMLPGEEELSALERGGNVAIESGLAGFGSKIGGMVSRGLEAPFQIPQRLMNRAYAGSVPFTRSPEDAAFAARGAQLSNDLNIPLSPAARSGSKMLTAAENMARQSAFSADEAFKADTKVAESFKQVIHNMLNRLGDPDVSATAVGSRIRNSMKGAMERVLNDRDQHAGTLYKQAIAEATRKSGKPIRFKLSHLVDRYDDLIAEYSPVFEYQGLVSRLKAARDHYASTPMSLEQAIRARTAFGRAAKGGASLFPDLDPGINKTVAKRIFAAVDDDFLADDGMLRALPEGSVEKWKAGNDLWRQFSQSADFIEKSPLASLLGDDVVDAIYSATPISTKAVEGIAERVLKLKPSQMEVTRDILARESPETWTAVKAYAISDALERGLKTPVSAGARSIPFNGPAFAKAIEGMPGLRQMFTAPEVKHLSDVIEAVRRWSDRTGFNFSGTAPMTELSQSVNAILSGALLKVGARALSSRQIAAAMLTPQGRTALLELSRMPQGGRRSLEIAASFVALAQAHDLGGDVGDDGNQ